MKGDICEKMGWTFKEFDDTPADELLHYLHLRSIYKEHKAKANGD